MQPIQFRVRDEIARYAVKIARERSVADAVIWRELVELGYQTITGQLVISEEESRTILDRLDLILKASVQTLTTTRRLTGHVDEGLVVLAKKDAISILESQENIG